MEAGLFGAGAGRKLNVEGQSETLVECLGLKN